MDSQRSKKSRSLGIDPNSHRPPAGASSSKRPELGERHNSAPYIAAHRKPGDSSRLSQTSRDSDRSKRASKASSRDDPLALSSAHAAISDSRPADRPRRSSRTTNTSNVSTSSGCKHNSELHPNLSQLADHAEIPIINLVVLGNRSVGKTTFVRNALDLRNPSTAPISASKVSLGGVLYRVQLLELPLADAECTDGVSIAWPKYVNGVTFPRIDGAFCLYDVTDKQSLAGVPQILSALTNSETPCCLVSCKTDVDVTEREVTYAFVDTVRKKFGTLAIEETSIHSSESAKRCLLKTLKGVLKTFPSSDRRRSQTSGSNSRTPSQSRGPASSRTSSTSRSRSRSRPNPLQMRPKEHLSSIPPPPLPGSQAERIDNADSSDEDQTPVSPPKTPLRLNTGDIGSSMYRRGGPQTPTSSTDFQSSRFQSPAERKITTVPETPESYHGGTMFRPDTAEPDDEKQLTTFLNMDDDSICEASTDTENTSNEKLQKLTLEETQTVEGVSFRDLVERLLTLPTSKGESKFVPSFLCLYRAFATPAHLLRVFIEHFVQMEKSGVTQFTKVTEQLRYLSVLAQWSANYPGDFAGAKVRETANAFVRSLEKSKTLAPAAKEISNNLQIAIADEDDDWAFADTSTTRSRANTSSQPSGPTPKTSSNDSLSKVASRVAREVDSDGSDSEGDDEEHAHSSPRNSGPPSSASSLLRAGNPSSQSAINLLALESAREQAKKLQSTPRLRLTKIQWHQFMEMSTEDLAREITRIDWTMYSAIRPRDFVRYVTLSPAQRSRPGYVDSIALMTKQFNHLALFVSGMILLREKPKHRAKILEKFMDLAWKVRQQNNYHSLGAIVAALNGEEIVRLVQTQELIEKETQKQFLRLKILMSHQRSHSAYRMAWENSSAERIPFLPRIQEDLTKAVSGNPTFVGANIKWSKFEVMGETIVNIQRSQEQAYTFPDRTQRSQDIARLILETKVLDGPEVCPCKT